VRGKFALVSVANDAKSICMFLFWDMFMDHGRHNSHGRHVRTLEILPFSSTACSCPMFLYPLYGNWVWAAAWLAQMGANWGLGHGHVDFAGSSVVHMTGGITALAGAMVLGRAWGKYRRDGTIAAIPGQQFAHGHGGHAHPGLLAGSVSTPLRP